MATESVRLSVQRAVQSVRRETFLPPQFVERSDEDRPLPIGYEQTISQPSLVAEMTLQLEVAPQHRVLEIGTGSGYQTAILAELASQVFTIERIPALAEAARRRLTTLGYRNVKHRTGAGEKGWPEAAPFDRIMVTAAPSSIPPAFIEQLAPGGRMVIPVGPNLDSQVLVLLTKSEAGDVERHELFGVRFVPLVPEA